MHEAQRVFCESVKDLYPERFRDCKVVDFGSLDINGNNRYLFEGGEYVGVDLGKGPNVDVISRAHEYAPPWLADVVISTEMLEHDENWEESLKQMCWIARDDGLVIFTCATTGRPEHGTRRTTPQDAPFVGDYYRNLTEEDIRSVLNLDALFKEYSITTGPPADLRFWGILKDFHHVDTPY